MDRSANMRAIRSKGMLPELAVRRLVHKLGYRYRLHSRALPGRPDLAFSARKKAIFVHGCFWHQHKNCKISHLPKSNLDYWMPKLQKNIARDKQNQARLKDLGWNVLVIWECQLKSMPRVSARICRFLK